MRVVLLTGVDLPPGQGLWEIVFAIKVTRVTLIAKRLFIAWEKLVRECPVSTRAPQR